MDDSDLQEVFIHSPDGLAYGTISVFLDEHPAPTEYLEYYLDERQAEKPYNFELLDASGDVMVGDYITSYFRYRFQIDSNNCLEDVSEWMVATGTYTYWMSMSQCEYVNEIYGPTVVEILDSLVIR